MKSAALFTTAIAASLASLASGVPVASDDHHPKWTDIKDHTADYPFVFTSTYKVVATPEQVINATGPTPGEPGAIGYFNYGINSELEVICYNITLFGVTGPYQSPANTATHIHEAAVGTTGPPRIAFPNPVPISDDAATVRRSVGCLTGPFLTGVMTNGVDSGEGFTLSQIEADPAAFFTDSHTQKYVPGVVRGQLA